jgi:hypothetical protein
MAVSARIEMVSVALIAVAVLLGGRHFLIALAHQHVAAMCMIAFLLVMQFIALRRNYAEGGTTVYVRVTRDVAFIAAAFLVFMVVASPQRWSIGAAIVAVEFGCTLDLLGRIQHV